ncbi:MAG: RagB/SusD family nutrient uptake outer membrane protein [Prevotella sp.]|nr:RagB/SusD family nutrient uptake outer membrane protein [Prevotella sp.]
MKMQVFKKYKMKKLRYYITFACVALSVICFSACDVLDKKPLDNISDATVWNDEVLIDADITGSYAKTTVLTNEADAVVLARNGNFFSIYFVNNVSDESLSASNFAGNAYKFKFGALKIKGGLLEYWERPYNIIRVLNELLERLPTAQVSPEFRKQRMAEVRFLRAFNYFAMVKRYGGIPLITKVQSKNDPESELRPARNKEQEVYDFIISEAKVASEDLPQVVSETDWGRPSKYAALALVSRAALYAGSIAQYGTVQLNGVVGIDNALANQYYQASYDASKAIINSMKYALYAEDADKVQNFKNIFLKKRNKEVIFARQHDGSDRDAGGNGWCYDYFQCPWPNGWSNGNHDAPYLEMAEAFEYKDGSPGVVKEAYYNKDSLITMEQLWKDKDPRFFATLYTQGTKWQGRTLNYYNGIIKEDGTIQQEDSYKGVLAKGEQKKNTCGFGVMKYLDETKDNGNSSSAGIFGSKQDYIVFRYGEILLNYAEAAFALGKTDEALDAINQIRERAGIAKLTTIDMDKIRQERRVELAFEGHRYWDLRRWRIAEDYLSRDMHGLKFILDYTTRKFRIQKIDKIDGATVTPLFRPENYYFPITHARTNQNHNLVENPGYN